MSAIVMAMVVGMALGSDGSERITTESVEHLCLDGEWEGTWTGRNFLRQSPYLGLLVHSKTEEDFTVRITPDRIEAQGKGISFKIGVRKWIDEDQGKFRYSNWLGIYKREGGRLFLCMKWDGSGRPTTFQAGEGQVLIVLKRAKPAKQ